MRGFWPVSNRLGNVVAAPPTYLWLSMEPTGIEPVTRRVLRLAAQGCFYEVKGTLASRLKRSREMWRLSARIASRLVFPSLMRRSR
jgi:hypothetical protein